jgi:hypothetical protein
VRQGSGEAEAPEPGDNSLAENAGPGADPSALYSGIQASAPGKARFDRVADGPGLRRFESPGML